MVPPHVLELHLDGVMGVARWHNVQVIVIGGKLGIAHVAALRASSQGIAAQHPGGTVGLSVVLPDTPHADATVLAAAVAAKRDLGERIRYATVVIEGDGVCLIATRAIIRSLSTRWGRRDGIVIEASVKGACQSVLRRVETGGAPPDAEELRGVVDKLRERVLLRRDSARRPRPSLAL